MATVTGAAKLPLPMGVLSQATSAIVLRELVHQQVSDNVKLLEQRGVEAEEQPDA